MKSSKSPPGQVFNLDDYPTGTLPGPTHEEMVVGVLAFLLDHPGEPVPLSLLSTNFLLWSVTDFLHQARDHHASLGNLVATDTLTSEYAFAYLQITDYMLKQALQIRDEVLRRYEVVLTKG